MSKYKPLSSVTNNIEHTNGLGNEHYISEKQFESEKNKIMFQNWCGLSFAKDIPNIGDVKPISFLGLSLLIIRENNDVINVFENTCRHRGMQLVNSPQNGKKNIRCPYHNWCYGLNGSLLATPHIGGIGIHTHKAIKPKSMGLNKIRSHIWHDIIFINISGAANDFTEYYSQLIDRWRDFEQPIKYGGKDSSFSITLEANWKLAVENYCESYHLPNIHPELNKISKLEDHYDIVDSNQYSGQGSSNYHQLRDEKNNAFPDFKDLKDKWQLGSEYIAIYPNVLIGVHRDHIFSIILEAISVNETRENIAFYYAKKLKSTEEINALKKLNLLFWKKIFKEDIYVVEGMQKGRYGGKFDGGTFSPVMDRSTHNFHIWITQQLN